MMDSSDEKNRLPQLDTIKNIAEAEAYKEAGTEKQANHLRQSVYNRALVRIAQEISKGDLAAYLVGVNGEFSKLPDDHELINQIHSFLADGIKTETQNKSTYNQFTRRNIYQTLSRPVNVEWVKRLYIPVDAGSPIKQAPAAQPDFDKANPTYPPELDIALQVWRAVSATKGKGKPKARIKEWLDNNTTLSNEAKERVAIVANWEKTGGATRTD